MQILRTYFQGVGGFLGTREEDLIRILVTRSEIDLFNIRKKFQRKYNKFLEPIIEVEYFKGPYKDGLVALVHGN